MNIPRPLLTWLLILALPLIVGLLILRQLEDPTADLVAQSRALADQNALDEAIAAMDAALALSPDNPLLLVERGQRILLIYEWDRARADFDRAIEVAPDYADAYYWRGVLFASVPDATARPEAAADFRRYLSLAPEGSYAEAARRALEALGETS